MNSANLERGAVRGAPVTYLRALVTRARAGTFVPENAVATEIAWRASLRAHELLTLQRVGKAQASGHRRWSDERFLGREAERYVVTGKGGLRRQVMIPSELATQLKARRLETVRRVSDRGIIYHQYYNVGGGNAWSKSFSDASMRALGWSHGAHGLRHNSKRGRRLTIPPGSWSAKNSAIFGATSWRSTCADIQTQAARLR